MLGIVIGAGDILVNRTSKLPILRNLNFFQWWLLLLLSHFSCVRLCDPIDGSPLGSSVPGILQARILEWVSLLQEIFLTQDQTHVSCVSCVGRQVLYH